MIVGEEMVRMLALQSDIQPFIEADERFRPPGYVLPPRNRTRRLGGHRGQSEYRRRDYIGDRYRCPLGSRHGALTGGQRRVLFFGHAGEETHE
jgi:hypothetical protein